MDKSFDWYQDVSSLKGVGEKVAQKLAKLQVLTVGDLLLHCPSRYEDKTRLTPIRDLTLLQVALIQGEIMEVSEERTRRKRCVITLVEKGARIKLVFFHYYANQLRLWKKGVTLRCFGQVTMAKGLQIVHPEFEVIDKDNPPPLRAQLTPVYPSVQGVSQNWLRRSIEALLARYVSSLEKKEDLVPDTLEGKNTFLEWKEALKLIHFPTPDVDITTLLEKSHAAYKRLIVDELLANHLSLKRLKHVAKEKSAPSLELSKKTLDAFLKTLPFTLTKAQLKTWEDICADLMMPKPMQRLVQGDVGCGKTVVGALAALAAISQGKQVAIMAPTEILAEQHCEQFNEWFEPLGFRTQLLSAKLKAKEKRSCLENITLGLAHIVIGTHALFQEGVQFNSLALVIIDEQHRFGVHQRLSLQQKGEDSRNQQTPHQLIMTATPIPRTLAMSHYAHLDVSVIDSLPPGRQTITTLTVPHTRREEIIERIVRVCEKKQQIYWVCTLIEESDTLSCKAAEVAAQELQEAIAPYRVGLVHGRMESEEKEHIMQAFYRGEISVLVATTVIEVGVNVPNATLMVIENPERLGLAQLHQLRGRVGRGSEKSYCILLYQGPLNEVAQARLSVMRETTDGFKIAQADLLQRGPGEILGSKQTGGRQFRIACLSRDEDILRAIPRVEAKVSNTLSNSDIDEMIKRWGKQSYFAKA